MKRQLIILLVASLAVISCKEETAFNPEGDAKYRFTFNGTWTEADHGSVPGNAHFTTFIGATHNVRGQVFELGASASPGIEEVAETGKIEIASGEMDDLLDDNKAFSKIIIDVAFGPQVGGTGEFTADEDFPYVSLASMIAPSPDWFVGLMDFELFDGTTWVETATFDINAYDAGTEDGDGFSLDNPDTDPRGTISMLNRNSFGTVTLTRIE